MTTLSKVRFSSLTSNVGAVIENADIDISKPLPAETIAQLRQRLLDYGVIFFRNQTIKTDYFSFRGYSTFPPSHITSASQYCESYKTIAISPALFLFLAGSIALTSCSP